MCSFYCVLNINFLFSNNSFSCLSFLFFLCFKFLVLRNITFLSQRIANTLYFKVFEHFPIFCLERSHGLIISFVVFLSIKLLWSSGVWIACFPWPLCATQYELGSSLCSATQDFQYRARSGSLDAFPGGQYAAWVVRLHSCAPAPVGTCFPLAIVTLSSFVQPPFHGGRA